MSLPGRHSLLWRLAGALALFCLLLVSLHVDVGRELIDATSYLSDSTRQTLRGYAREAETTWREEGASGVDTFLQRLHEREQVWAVVVDSHKDSLSSRPLTPEEAQRLDFVRRLSFPVGRPGGTPTFYVPFSDGEARLVMELPQRLNPRKYNELWELLLQRVLPAILAVAVAVLLYRLLIAPLAILRRQAAALSAGDLSARLGPQVTRRRDELGELARTFDHMAERLEGTVAFQRQLLRDLSHELRTPLARLRVAGESEQDIAALRQRLAREVQEMEKLVGDALELVWLDTERPSLPLEEVDIVRLWDVLRENAGFETGWSSNACHATCRPTAGCWAISMAWRRRWKTSCAMPFATRRQTASCAWAASVMRDSGCCGSRIRGRVSRKTKWKPSSAPLPDSALPVRAVMASAWDWPSRAA